MWKGAIQFGLVTIPVKLYLATESSYQIRFNMLHEKDQSPDPDEDVVPGRRRRSISRADTVKGYEYAPDQYVVITDEDLEKVPLKTVRSIEIEQFAKPRDEDDRSTRFVKQAYYIEPDKIGRKAFYLLRSVLQDEGPHRDLQGRDQGPRGARVDGPVRRHDAPHDPPLARRDPRDERARPARRGASTSSRPSCAMAEQLVEAMTGDFDPSKYKDEYREALMQVIESKIEGQRGQVAPPDEPERQASSTSWPRLEASVNAATALEDEGKPVSVADEKKAKDEAAAKKPAAKAKTKAADEDEAETRPTRRRKSA